MTSAPRRIDAPNAARPAPWTWYTVGVTRDLFTFASAISLMMSVVVCAVWVRSYRTADIFIKPSFSGVRTFGSSCGQISYFVRDDSVLFEKGFVHWPPRDTVPWMYFPTIHPIEDPELNDTWAHALGFILSRRQRVQIRYPIPELATSPPVFATLTDGTVPDWFVVAAFGVLPACWIAARLRRRKPGGQMTCICCGYDLRASPDRCPECGETFKR